PSVKELNFFFGRNWERGVEWYETWFEGADDAVAVGEDSPSYTRYPLIDSVPANLAATVPAAKLVYIVRHPIERILSQYRMLVTQAATRLPIDRVVRDDTEAIVSASKFAMQID